MRTNFLFTLVIITACCFSLEVYSLAPVESLVLGNFSEDYSENKSDPLNYVFTRDQSIKNSSKSFKEELAIYRGFYEEGKNITNFCKNSFDIRYPTDWEKIQVKRSIISLVQYVGLDLATRAIPKYAKALEFTREEYSNLAEGLVGNYCSANLSVISKRELLNNLFLKFDKENNFVLPNVDGNPYFPDNLDQYLPPKKALEQEFLYTVKLFQSLCSWNGDPENPGLISPLLRNSALMAFFSRQMSNQQIGWKEIDNTIFLREDKKTVQVWCENLICRKVERDEFLKKFYFALGSSNVAEDVKRLYCEDFRNVSPNPKEYDPRIAKMMNGMTFDEENFLSSQFIALVTGVPDFLLNAEKFSMAEDLLRSSVDYSWTKWAKRVSDNFTNDLYFEEPLTLEQVDRDQYYNFRSGELKVAFDINLGEFDRINQLAGKLKVSFNLFVPKNFLEYYRATYKNLGFNEDSERTRLKKRFKLHIAKFVQEAREKFLIPPWKGDLEGLIVNELTAQILDTPQKFLNFSGTGSYKIGVELNYGLFALKYLNHQFNVQKQKEMNQLVPKK